MEKKVSVLLKTILIGLGIFIVCLNIRGSMPQVISAYGMGYAFGENFSLIIGFFIALFCADKCSKWALKINKNLNFAWSIGFIFGLLGLLSYFIFMKIKRKNTVD